MDNLIHHIPKAELHLHIEGTLEPELMFELAKRNGIRLKYQSVAEVHQAYQFQNLQSFLNIYYEAMQVLVTEQDFYDLAKNYLTKAKKQNIRHVEIFFDPQAHLSRGIAFETVINGLHHALVDAEKQLGMTSQLILCFLRDQSEESAIETLKLALPFQKWIIAIGLDSAEKNNPPVKFKNLFEMAHAEGFLAVAHAGEEGPPEYIWQALELLRVLRIDHGVRCMEDPQLVNYLIDASVPLTVCPLSNVKLRVVDHLKDHPLKKMLETGLCATINSDDPAYFGGYLNENMFATNQALQLTSEQLYQLQKNAFLGSFLPKEKKLCYIEELEQCCRQYKT